MAEVRFGIVGAGMIAESHAKAIAEVEGARLTAVASRNPDSAARLAAEFGGEAVNSLEAMLARDDVDAVCVTTPSGAHAEVAVPSLKAGKHVFCEKPLEISLDRIDAMIAAAKEGNALLAGVFQFRYGAGARRIKQAIDAGRFGKLTYASCHVKWWREQSYYDGTWKGTQALDGGGALMNQGIHAVDLLQWLAGMPTEVRAFTGTLAHTDIEVEDTVAAALKFPNGALGVIEAATSVWPGFSIRVEISGDKGSAIVEDGSIKFWQFAEEGSEDEEIRSAQADTGIKSGASDPRTNNVEGHIRQITDLVAAIQGGDSSKIIGGEEGRRAVQLVLSVYEAARTGQPVVIGG